MHKLTEYRLKVLDNLELLPGVHYLKLDKSFSFIPGQVLNLRVPEMEIPRIYSIASGINEEFTGILFDIKNDGKLTPLMARLYCSAPFGGFFPMENSYCIATGTGIAPFLSLLRSGMTKFNIIQGARSVDYFLFQKEIVQQLNGNYIRCISGSSVDGFYTGRLTKYLKNEADLSTGMNYFLCGSAEMVADTREVLLSRKIPYNNITAEIYF